MIVMMLSPTGNNAFANDLRLSPTGNTAIASALEFFELNADTHIDHHAVHWAPDLCGIE